tara:strand:- start:221 stop:751 length:531 start_codon:yes stop_codon:yes gene_type:complete
MFVWEFLAVGALGFWLLLVLSAILMSEMLDNDAPGWATIVAMVTVAVLVVFGGVNPISYLAEHPGEIVLGIAAYFFAGAVWSLVKWYFWLVKLRRRIDAGEAQDRVLYTAGVRQFPPHPGDHKSRIIGWIALWPASMLWTMINDPVRRAAEEIYARLGGTYQHISNRVFKGYDKNN